MYSKFHTREVSLRGKPPCPKPVIKPRQLAGYQKLERIKAKKSKIQRADTESTTELGSRGQIQSTYKVDMAKETDDLLRHDK